MKSNNYKQDEKTKRFVATGNPRLAERPIAIRLPIEVDEEVRQMSNRAEFIRSAITEALKLRDQNKAS